MASELDYVLGTHDEEVARLDLQHRVWRARAVAAWERAGFAAGHHVLDVGCGPGFATVDLARLTGRDGRVIALDQSRRFLNRLRHRVRAEGLANVMTVECDLDDLVMRGDALDGAWMRWVLAFVRHPRELLCRIAERLRPGGTIAIHEYFDYGTWRSVPPSEELDTFVRAVMASWRAAGGEPDIALILPRSLEELGFEVTHLQPIVDLVTPADPQWRWLTAFIESGSAQLVARGELAPDHAEALATAASAWRDARPPVRMITPAVLEIIAMRR